MTNIILSFFIVCIFMGCTTTQQNPVVYEQYQPKVLHVKKQKTVTSTEQSVYAKRVYKTRVKKALNGTIKGNITNLVYRGGIWHYTVKGIDTSNNKLAYAEFKSRQKYANQRDLVYAIIKDGIVKEMFLVKKANYKKKIVKKNSLKKEVKKRELHKRTKKRQVLQVPTSERINLD